MRKWEDTWKKFMGKYRYFLIITAAGILLMLCSFPTSAKEENVQNNMQSSFDLPSFEQQIGQSLSAIDGAGRVSIMLTLESTEQSVYASDSQISQSSGDGSNSSSSQTTMSIISDGSYGETPVLIQSNYPKFRGAVIICDGADNSEVCLEITKAVSSLCDLTSNHITIVKMSR